MQKLEKPGSACVRRSRQEVLGPLADIKLGFRREEAAFLVGSVQLFDEMVAAKWIQPVVARHKLTLFDRGDISKAWVRILNGEVPPKLQRWGGNSPRRRPQQKFTARRARPQNARR